jgi:hypothetical protein
MAIKYGQELILTAAATGSDLVYVWEWWDGTTSVTSTNVARKVANRWGTLSYSVTAVDPLGNKNKYSSTIAVDRPPEFLSVTLTKNNGVFPYNTQLTARVTGSQYPISCTFNGSNISINSGTADVVFSMDVIEPSTQMLVATDNVGVTSQLPIYLFGGINLPPSVTVPAAVPPIWRVNSTGTLVAVASDPEGGPVTFQWTLSDANGWSGGAVMNGVPGNLSVVGNGTQSVLVVNTAGQTATQKYVELVVTDNRGLSTHFDRAHSTAVPVLLTLNSNPVIETMTATPSSALVGQAIVFSARASDPQGDAVNYRWTITGPISNAPSIQHSRVAVVCATGTGSVTSSLQVTDAYGGVVTSPGPTVVIS